MGGTTNFLLIFIYTKKHISLTFVIQMSEKKKQTEF